MNSSEFIKYGEDVFIAPNAIIKHPTRTSIGSHVAIDPGVIISIPVSIGDYVHIAPYVCMIGGQHSSVILHDFSFVAAGTKIVAGSEDYTGTGLIGPTIPKLYRNIHYTTVTFHRFSGCGVNCSIMPGVTFGEGAILGANSLATKDLEPWTIYVGSPAKPVKSRPLNLIKQYAQELGYAI